LKKIIYDKIKNIQNFYKKSRKKIKSKKNKDSNWNNQNKYDQLVIFKKGKRKEKKKSLITNHPSFVNMHHIRRKST
jgi:hypothetical protein